MLFVIIALFSILCSFFFPWWFAAIIAFSAALFFNQKPGFSFLSGFAALFISWTLLALFRSIPNEHILATRVAHLVGLPHWIFILLITALIGGLIGGMSALSGSMIRRVFS